MRNLWLVSLVAAGAACGKAPAPVTAPAPTPSSAPTVAPSRPTPSAPAVSRDLALPPFPDVRGALALDVVYPVEGHVMAARESTFIFGATGNGQAELRINGAPVTVHPNGSFLAFLPVPADSVYALEASLPSGERASLSRRIRFPVRATGPRPPAPSIDTVGYPRVMTLRNTNADAVSDTDQVTVAYATPTGTYRWFLMPGTLVQATGRLNGSTRIRLDEQLDVWVENAGVAAATDTVVRRRTITDGRVVVGADFTDIVLPMTSRAPYLVDQSDTRFSLTLYGAVANIALMRYDTRDPSVRVVRWEQVSHDRVRVDVDLRHPAVGYQVMWRNGAMVLRVRHMPRIDVNQPLKGRVIAVDPGHPPIGSTGPTRLREPEATLAVGRWVKQFLEEAGAQVVMLRTDMNDVALGARPIAARRANAEAFVSIHLNAFADGANPFAAARGSGTFFFHPQSEPLAREVQRGLVERMGLRDEGVFFNNLAVARPTWFPAVLCEGAWVVMPEQEAALRTPEFQQRYARGIVDGLARYFAALGSR